MGLIIKDGVKYGGSPDFTDYRAEQVTLDAKNLLPITGTTQTVNGVTYTIQSDGTIKANGTASSDSYFTVWADTTNTLSAILTSGKSYILSGCPTTYSASNVYLYINGSPNIVCSSSGETTFTYDSTIRRTGISIYVKSGQTVSNAIFSPMIRLATDPVATYAPYAKTNKQLTDDFFDITDESGTKNLEADTETTLYELSNVSAGYYLVSVNYDFNASSGDVSLRIRVAGQERAGLKIPAPNHYTTLTAIVQASAGVSISARAKSPVAQTSRSYRVFIKRIA